MTNPDDRVTTAASDSRALNLAVFVSPTHPIPGGNATFSPTTSTLIYGEHEAVLVDAQYIRQDVDDLGDLIEHVGKRLTTIFITHGHADHYFGVDVLAARFPGARVLAAPSVAADIRARHVEQVATFTAWFGDKIAVPASLPEPLKGCTITVDGCNLDVIEVEQADIAPSTVLHVPSLGALVAGDLAYDRIHPMLALTDADGWKKWIASLDAVSALTPRVVVAGHKAPESSDDGQTILDDTRAYLRHFAEHAQTANTTRELVETMQALYPEHGNITTLLVSSRAAVKARAS